MRLFIFLLLSTTVFLSCTDDDTETPSVEVTDLEIVTGVVLTDANGQGNGSVGNPNWYNGLILYPNPPQDVQTAALQSGEEITEVYVIPAAKNTDFTSAEVMDAMENFDGYTAAELQTNAVVTSSQEPSVTQFQYRLDGLNPGYYRVIVTDVLGIQHGSNIFIDSTLSYPSGLTDFLISDWQ
ncbi:MAG: hypothetical protein AB8F78_17345 [Saprospiraceae bacterium]